MKTKNVTLRSQQIITFLGLLVLGLSAGCGGNGDNAAVQAGRSAIVGPSWTSAGAATDLSLGISGAVDASWSFTDSNNQQLYPYYSLNANGLSGEFTFMPNSAQSTGTVNITVTYHTASGTTATASGTINVELPPPNLSSIALTSVISQNGSQIAKVSNLSSSAAPAVVMKQASTFDLSQSTIPVPSQTNLQVNWSDGSAVASVPGTSLVLSHTFSSPGTYPVVINAVAPGAAGSLTIMLQVGCDSSVAPLVVNSVAVSPVDNDNMYSFVANVSGGYSAGKYTSAWSVDGTNVWRAPLVQGLNVKYYVDYGGPVPNAKRLVQVQVSDLSCPNRSAVSYSMQYQFDFPEADGVAGNLQGPQVGNVPFIQGVLSSSSSPQDLRMNGLLSVLEAASDLTATARPDFNQRLTGGFNATSGGNYGFSSSGINPINDNKDGIVINATFAPVSSGSLNFTMTSIQNVTVYVAGNDQQGPALVADAYTSSSCTGAGTASILMGANPCAGEAGQPAQVSLGYWVDYTYSCPNLQDTAGNSMALTKGAGYYLVNTTPQSCGGGQGGGGTPPPAF